MLLINTSPRKSYHSASTYPVLPSSLDKCSTGRYYGLECTRFLTSSLDTLKKKKKEKKLNFFHKISKFSSRVHLKGRKNTWSGEKPKNDR